MIWLKLAWREIINTPKFTLFFVLNVALGLTGFITVDALKSSIDQSLSSKSQEILGADLAVSAFRDLDESETAVFDALVPPGTRIAKETGWASMVAAIQPDDREAPAARLMEIRAVDVNFPFYGKIEFESADGSPSTEPIFEKMSVEPLAIASPELFFQLGLRVGDSVRIGEQTFRLAGKITNDPSTSSASFAIAPRIYIGQSWDSRTGLIQLGSRVVRTRKYAIPAQALRTPTGEIDLDDIETRFKEYAKSRSDIRVRSHMSATDELGRMLKFLGDYLGIVALVAVILSAVGGNFLILAHLRSKIRDLAILQSVGASPFASRVIVGWQMVILGACGAFSASIIAAMLLPTVRQVLAPFLGSAIRLGIQPDSVVTAFILGCVGTPVAGLPVFLHLGRMNAATLFREHLVPTGIRGRQWILAAIPSILVIFGLASWQARSLRTGVIFLVITGLAMLILSASGLLLLKSLGPVMRSIQHLNHRLTWPLVLALRQTRRSGQRILVTFVTLGLCAALISAVPQMRAVLTSELTSTGTTVLPGLFLFDIQPGQEKTLEEFLVERKLPPGDLSPLIRARLETIDGQSVSETFDKIPGTRERETEERFKNRTYNLSVRGKLSDSEVITEGRDFSSPHFNPETQDLPEISIEKRFSERTGIKIGNILEFNIQGIPVKGRVVNLRRVRWASFQPNFFVQFQKGVIDDAPRTSLATVPKSDFESTQLLQRELAQKFPNISIVDVKSSVDRILAISDQVALAITAMALLCLVSGLGVLTAIILQQSRARAFETAVLKVLGASFREVYVRTVGEAAIIAVFAASCGLVISFGIAWVISVVIFDGVWVFAARAAALPAILITLVTILVTVASSRFALGARARELLQSDGT